MNRSYFFCILSLLFLTGTLLNNSCTTKPISVGSNDKIVVLADSTLWGKVEVDVRNVIEREMFTPQPERIFSIVLKDPKDISDATRFPHILLLGTLNSEGSTRTLLDGMLNETLIEKIEQDSLFVFQKKDIWARDQILVVMVCRDVPTLVSHLRGDKDLLFRLFDDHAQEIVKTAMYRFAEQKELGQQLMQEHGWSVRAIHDYFVAIDSTQARFVWLRRMGPQREFFVYWEPVADPSVLSKQWMVQKRDSLTKIYYQGDYIDTVKVNVVESNVDFQGWFAIRLDGVWQNEINISGGPFRSYAFYNEDDGRMYLVDCSVVAPGQRKWAYMRQLDVMAHTFRTAQSKESEAE
jgi:hypothetical protein